MERSRKMKLKWKSTFFGWNEKILTRIQMKILLIWLNEDICLQEKGEDQIVNEVWLRTKSNYIRSRKKKAQNKSFAGTQIYSNCGSQEGYTHIYDIHTESKKEGELMIANNLNMKSGKEGWMWINEYSIQTKIDRKGKHKDVLETLSLIIIKDVLSFSLFTLVTQVLSLSLSLQLKRKLLLWSSRRRW